MEDLRYSLKTQSDKIFNWVIQQCKSLCTEYMVEFPFLNLDLAFIVKQEMRFSLDVGLEKLAIKNLIQRPTWFLNKHRIENWIKEEKCQFNEEKG